MCFVSQKKIFLVFFLLIGIPAVCIAASSLPGMTMLADLQEEITERLVPIIVTIMIATSALMLLFGNGGETSKQCFRIILGVGIALHFGNWVVNVFPQLSQDSSMTVTPTPFPGKLTDDNFMSMFMNYYIALCIHGAANIQGPALKLLGILASIEIAMAVAFQLEQDNVKYILTQTIKIGFLIFLINEWVGGTYGIAANISAWFEKLGLLAAGQPMLEPNSIVNNGLVLIDQIWAKITKLGISSLGLILANLVILVGVVLSVFFTAIQLFMVRVEFWTISLMTIPLLPFGMYKHTRFLFEKAIGAVFNLGLKVGVTSFIAAIAGPLLQAIAAPMEDASMLESLGILLRLFLGCLVVCVMVMRIPDLVQGLLTGNPSLSGSDMIAPARTAVGTARAAYSGGLSAMGSMALVSAMEGSRTANGGISKLGMMLNMGRMAQNKMARPFHDSFDRGAYNLNKQRSNNEIIDNARNGSSMSGKPKVSNGDSLRERMMMEEMDNGKKN